MVRDEDETHHEAPISGHRGDTGDNDLITISDPSHHQSLLGVRSALTYNVPVQPLLGSDQGHRVLRGRGHLHPIILSLV